MKKHSYLPCFLLTSALGFATHATAGTTWDGGGTDDNWGTAANWNPDGSPPVGATVDLTFDGSTRLNSVNNYTAFDDFHSLTFAGTAGAFTLSGSAIDLFGKIENYSTATQTIGMDLAINAGQPGTGEFNPINGDLVINSANVFTNGNTLHVYGTNGKTVTFGAGTVISQAGHFNVEQASNVVFLGNNTYTGTTNVLAGSLTVGNGGTTGSTGTGTVTVASGASLTYNRSDAVTLSQTLNIGGALVKNGAGTLTISGAQTGITGTVAINTGRISMGANNSLGTATVTLNGGTIERNAAAVTVANAIAIGASGGTILGRQVVDDYTNFSGQLTGSGSLTVQGLVALGNNTNTHSGSVAISNTSTTYLRLSASEVLGNNSAVTMGGTNANFRLDGGVTETIGSLAGSGNVFVSNVGGGLVGTLKLGGDNTSTAYTGQLNNNDGQLQIVKQGTGTFTLSPSVGTFQGLTISNGTVLAGSGNYGSATITLGDAATGVSNVAFLTTSVGSSRNITVSSNGSGTATIGSTTGAGTGNVNFSGLITLNRATTMTAASTDRTTWTGKITGNVGTLTFTGGQRTVLDNLTNDFVGNVIITGTNTVLQTGVATGTEHIPNASSVTVDTGAILKLAGVAGSAETINGINGSGTIQRHDGLSGLVTLTIGSADGGGSFNGVLGNGAGSLALVKAGTGTQTLNRVGGNNAAIGSVTVNAGELTLVHTTDNFDRGYFTLATPITINAGGTLNASSFWTIKSTNVVTVNGGTLNFNTAASSTSDTNYVNNLTLQNGALISGTGGFRVGNVASTLTLNSTGNATNRITTPLFFIKNTGITTYSMNVADGTVAIDMEVSGNINDNASFTGMTLNKSGAGLLRLSGTSGYIGGTSVSNGTLEGATNTAFGTGSVTLGDATTGSNAVSLYLANRADVSNAVTVSALGSGLVKLGASNTGAGANAATFLGTVTLNRATTLSGEILGDRLAFDGKITGNVGTLTVAGGSRTSFFNIANDFVGNVLVTGTDTVLQASVGTAAEVIPNGSSVTVDTGAILQLASSAGAETIDALNGAGIVRTFSGGTFGSGLNVGSAGGSGSFPGSLQNGTAGNPLSFTKLGSGEQSLSGNNTYTGTTALTGGTLLLASATALPSTAAFNLSTGTTLKTSGFNNSTGPISFASGTAIFDFSGTASTITFADIGTWAGVLQVWNYDGGVWNNASTDKLIFTANTSTLDLSSVQFFSNNGTAQVGIGSAFYSGTTGQLVPVPETSTAVATALLLGLVGYRERRSKVRLAGNGSR
jgi:fibronectin-binding autotransporter adhesin